MSPEVQENHLCRKWVDRFTESQRACQTSRPNRILLLPTPSSPRHQPGSPRSHLNGFPASLCHPPLSPSTFYHLLSAPPHRQPLHLPHPFCTSLPQLLTSTPPTSHLHLNQSPLLAFPPPEQPMYLGEDPQLQAYTTQVNLLFHHLQIFLVASCNHRPCLCKVGGLQRPNHLRICSSAKNSEY